MAEVTSSSLVGSTFKTLHLWENLIRNRRPGVSSGPLDSNLTVTWLAFLL
jgi:hypothetical protein